MKGPRITGVATRRRFTRLARLARLPHCVGLSLSLALWLPMAAHAQAGAPTPSTAPAADKVFPPLPSLDMLPSESSTSDTPAATSRGGKKNSRRVVKSASPKPVLVVSEASRAYLRDVEREINQAMSK